MSQRYSLDALRADLTAGLVVFLVAIPLCLGIAVASQAEPISGLIAGVVGGIVVGALSGSHTSVSGPAAGMTAVVVAQLAILGSFETFLMAVIVAGGFQILMGVLRLGFIAAFFPSSVIKGLLAAIGILLILKQLPHLVGHDSDPEGEMSFHQPNQATTFSALLDIFDDLHAGAAVVGFVSLAILILWERNKRLKSSFLPSQLVVVLMGVGFTLLSRKLGAFWTIDGDRLVNVPIIDSVQGFFAGLKLPTLAVLTNLKVWISGATIALVASLETLLNLEAVDKLDKYGRKSPPNRELLAQGVGNVVSGFLGGLPMTSVIVRSSVNVHSGARTKLSAIFHGFLLLTSVVLLPTYLSLIPLSCLAAILLVTGYKLAHPKLIRQMWNEGLHQFAPFAATIVSIVLTDLLTGTIIGLCLGLCFILHSNLRRPIRLLIEKHLGGDVYHIELANQVSFLNRARLTRALAELPDGSHILLDARNTDYIDPDILDLINDFAHQTAPARGMQVSLLGFQSKYRLVDRIQYVDYSTRELQAQMRPEQVLKVLLDGNERFRTGQRLPRDLNRAVDATAKGQFPLAVILSCIDSRSPAELIFDLGVGDIFSVRIAGNVAKEKVFGSLEYACAVAGSKLVLILGHTRCGAVATAVRLYFERKSAFEATGCEHLDALINEIKKSIRSDDKPDCTDAFITEVARRNVLRTADAIRRQSHTLERLEQEGKIMIAGALYHVESGRVEMISPTLEELGWKQKTATASQAREAVAEDAARATR